MGRGKRRGAATSRAPLAGPPAAARLGRFSDPYKCRCRRCSDPRRWYVIENGRAQAADTSDWPELDPNCPCPACVDRNPRLFSDVFNGDLRIGEPLFLFDGEKEYHASVTADGSLQLEDGRAFAELEGAATALIGSNGSDSGWGLWHVRDEQGYVTIFDYLFSKRSRRDERESNRAAGPYRDIAPYREAPDGTHACGVSGAGA